MNPVLKTASVRGCQTSWICLIAAGLFFAYTPSLHADLLDQASQAEARWQKLYVDRFGTFTQDKNVQGVAKTPDGKRVGGGPKTRSNKDDKNPFQSDLTYHDLPYDKNEQVKQDPNKDNQQQNANNNNKEQVTKVRKLYGFTSDHGKVSKAGGSSELERTVYGLHEKHSKEEEERVKNGAVQEEKGVKSRSLYTQTIKDLDPAKAQNQGQANNQNQNQGSPEEAEKVDRWEMKPDAVAAVQKVGEDSFETVAKAAKDPDKKEDASAMVNSIFMYEAANRDYKAMYTNALAALGQRRINRGIRDKALGTRVQLSEGVANCDTWAAQISSEIQSDPRVQQNPEQQKQLLEDVARMTQQCKQMASQPINAINPKFEANNQNGGGQGQNQEQLVQKGSDKEDGRQRDERVLLETLAKAGITASDVQSNWNYSDKDLRAPVTLSYDENAQPGKEQLLTVKEQIELYNQDLRAASQDLSRVQARLPEFNINPQAPLQYLIPTNGEVPTWGVTKIPDHVYQEDFGVKAPPSNDVPKTYQDLVTTPEDRI